MNKSELDVLIQSQLIKNSSINDNNVIPSVEGRLRKKTNHQNPVNFLPKQQSSQFDRSNLDLSIDSINTKKKPTNLAPIPNRNNLQEQFSFAPLPNSLSAWPKSESVLIQAQSQSQSKLTKKSLELNNDYLDNDERRRGRGRFRGLKGRASVDSLVSSSLNDLAVPEIDINQKTPLVEAVGDVFKEIYLRRSFFPGQGGNPSTEDNNHFQSRLQTPPEISRNIPESKSTEIINKLLYDWGEGHETLSNHSSSNPQTLADIKEEYRTELGHFDSISLYIETRYIEMKEREPGLAPSKIKAAVCAELIYKLSRSIGRFADILEPLIWELLNCIFIDFSEHEKNQDGNYIRNLANIPTYFDAYQQAVISLDEYKNEMHVVEEGVRLKDIVKRFQVVRLAFDEASVFICHASFRLWKIYWRKRKQLRTIARQRYYRYRFNIWKSLVTNTNYREMKAFSDVLDKKINMLTDLNNLLNKHNSQELNKQTGDRNMIGFDTSGTSTQMDPTLVPAPLKIPSFSRHASYSTPSHNRRQSFDDSISNQKNLVNQIDHNLQQVMSTIQIVSSPIHRNNNNNTVSSHENMSKENEDLLRAVEQTVHLAQEALDLRKDAETQTPSDGIFSTSQSPKHNRDKSILKQPVLPPMNISAEPLSIAITFQLISYIYEIKFLSHFAPMSPKHNRNLMNPSLSQLTFYAFAKQVIQLKYRDEALSTHFFEGMIACVLKEYAEYKRLYIFGILLGIVEDHSYSQARCDFFFKAIEMIYEHNLEEFILSFLTFDIERTNVLNVLPSLFPDLETLNAEMYSNMVFELIDMPSSDETTIETNYKINVDDCLLFLIKYFDQNESLLTSVSFSSNRQDQETNTKTNNNNNNNDN